jgi:hypothetical protein
MYSIQWPTTLFESLRSRAAVTPGTGALAGGVLCEQADNSTAHNGKSPNQILDRCIRKPLFLSH